MVEVTVNKSSDGQKIEKFVRHTLNEAPMSFIYKLFRKKDIKINGHWVDKNAIVKEGDTVKIFVTDNQLNDFSKPREAIKKDFPHEIVYEDSNVLIANKPKGLLVLGDAEGNNRTLTNDVINYLYFKNEFDPINHSFVPAPAHRLDRNTSGLIIYGKNEKSLSVLTELFKEHLNIQKKYITLVKGILPKEGVINKPLKKDSVTGTVSVVSTSVGGKESITKYKLIKEYGDYSLAEVTLITGRTHQIRVHMSSINYPIVGDSKYGNFADCKFFSQKFGLNSQFLHANEISFFEVPSPLNYLSNKKYISDLPKYLKDILIKL